MPQVENGPSQRADKPVRRPRTLNVKMLCVCLAMVWLGAVVRRPYLIAAKMEAENRRDERRVMELKLLNQSLRKDVQALDTPAGMEREARRLGYVREGEALLVIPK